METAVWTETELESTGFEEGAFAARIGEPEGGESWPRYGVYRRGERDGEGLGGV